MRRYELAVAAIFITTFAASSAKDSAQTDRVLNWRFSDARIIAGASDADPFGNIQSIASDGNAHFAVLDRTTHQIHAFNADGVYQWSAGREGDGPGELRAPISVNAGGEGSFFVTDQRHLRVSRYGPAGVHLGDVQLPDNDFYVFENTAGPAGWYFAVRLQQDNVTQMFSQKLLRWRRDSVAVLSTYAFRLRPQVTRMVCPGLNARNDQRPLYEPELLWSTNGSTVVWRGGWADYRVRVMEANGSQREVRRDLPPAPVTEQMAIAAQGGRERVTANCRYDRLDLIRARGWAPSRPVIQRLKALPDGALWVSRFSAAGDTLIDVFDSRGTYSGTLPQGSRMPDAFLAGNRVVYKSALAGGEPVVRIVQISKSN